MIAEVGGLGAIHAGLEGVAPVGGAGGLTRTEVLAFTPAHARDASLAVLAVLGLRILTPGEARRAIDLDVVLLIAAGFGVAAAMTKSGLAEQIASGLVSSFGSLGDFGVLLAIVLATVLLTETVSNTAAAVLSRIRIRVIPNRSLMKIRKMKGGR